MTSPATAGSRATAAAVIARWLETGAFPDRLLHPVERDRSFVTELVYGVVRWRRVLDWVLGRLVPRAPEPAARSLLLVGLYQLLLADGVADHAAVHETVEAAKPLGARRTRFVNGVLRRAQRERTALREAIERQPPGVRWSHPDLLIRRWTERFGAADTAALCRWNNTAPRVSLRPHNGRAELERVLRALHERGVEAVLHPHRTDPPFLVLPHGVRVNELPGFREGWWSVQDPSTAVAVELLAPRPGERVLDACAAPGGKTTAIAERLRGDGEVVAMDLHEDRLVRLRENVARLGLDGVQVVRADAAARPAPEYRGAFDRVLLDGPCTNTGVLRRRADARWRFTRKRLAALVRTQRRLLDAAPAFLKAGGLAVFSTCSLEPEEGERQVRGWLADHPGSELLAQRLLFPPHSGTDGVYAAAIRVG